MAGGEFLSLALGLGQPVHPVLSPQDTVAVAAANSGAPWSKVALT